MSSVAISVSPWQRLCGAYVRGTARYPALASLVPFVPVVALWAAVAGAGIFPRVFFPGPVGHAKWLLAMGVVSVLVFLAGYWFFDRLRDSFAEAV